MSKQRTIEGIQGIQSLEGITRDEMLKSVRVGQTIKRTVSDRKATILKKSFDESGGGWFIEVEVKIEGSATPTTWRSEKVLNQDELVRYIEKGDFLTHPDYPDEPFKVQDKDLVNQEKRYYFRLWSSPA